MSGETEIPLVSREDKSDSEESYLESNHQSSEPNNVMNYVRARGSYVVAN